MASQYGYTPKEIFALTPAQYQLLSSRAQIRTHNDFQAKIALEGGKPDFIDMDEQKAMHRASIKNESTEGVEHDIVNETLRKKREDKQKNVIT